MLCDNNTVFVILTRHCFRRIDKTCFRCVDNNIVFVVLTAKLFSWYWSQRCFRCIENSEERREQTRASGYWVRCRWLLVSCAIKGTMDVPVFFELFLQSSRRRETFFVHVQMLRWNARSYFRRYDFWKLSLCAGGGGLHVLCVICTKDFECDFVGVHFCTLMMQCLLQWYVFDVFMFIFILIHLTSIRTYTFWRVCTILLNPSLFHIMLCVYICF